MDLDEKVEKSADFLIKLLGNQTPRSAMICGSGWAKVADDLKIIEEISYDETLGTIKIDPSNYYDAKGKQGIKEPEKLKEYILNIYKTMMLRGIKGTYIYVCDPALRAYFKNFVKVHNNT